MKLIEDLKKSFLFHKNELIANHKKDLLKLGTMVFFVIWLGYVMVNTRGGYG